MIFVKFKATAKPPRRIRGKWTIELTQDLESMYGLDLEEELTQILRNFQKE